MKSYRMVAIVLAVSLACLASTVQADTTNLVVNGDFTMDTAGWSGNGVWNSGTDGSPDGASIRQTGAAWFYQQNTTPLVAGQTYKLSFLAALLSTNGNVLDETLVAHVSDPSGNPYGYVLPRLTSTWTQYSFQFTPTASNVGTYGVAFLNSAALYPTEFGGGGGTGGAGQSCLYGIDSVSLTAVPEPTTALCLFSGIIGLLAYAWRRSR